ncbi:hypothetical protein IQ13_3236 [Lacibacter cauensis]|uniref:Uncharacterized protein n=1 Tax=Lacibacter cauensis TaxID=510947 RepID=A0A562SHC8_9BACT|nr:hypothetical protein [Lacibacter cauensis]TWI80558.1 hypothetical protein IQ13_3236 [Lacibacter cauensis]
MVEVLTPALKDKLLEYIVKNAELEKHVFGHREQFVKETELSISLLQAALYQFERLGLLKDVGIGSLSVEFTATAELHDFYLRGGFTVKEEILEKNIEKLMFEIDHLKKSLTPDQLDTANRLSSIAQGIGAAVQILTTIK